MITTGTVCNPVCTYETMPTVELSRCATTHRKSFSTYELADGARFELASAGKPRHTLSSRQPQDAHTLKTSAQLHLTPHALSARHSDISIVVSAPPRALVRRHRRMHAHVGAGR